MADEIVKYKIDVGDTGLQLRTLDDMFRFAKYAVKSGLVPESFKTPEQVLIAIQSGLELGLPPMKALSSICVIKGRPCLWGDTALGLVKNSGKLESCDEYFELNGKSFGENEVQYDKIDLYPANLVAVCKTKRVGDADFTIRYFSIADAKLAGLWKKAGPWTTHPKRMLKYKARAFNLRDAFPDILCGMHLTEEMIDQAPLPMAACDTPPRDERRKPVESTVSETPPASINPINLTRDEVAKIESKTTTLFEKPSSVFAPEVVRDNDVSPITYEQVKAFFESNGGKSFTSFSSFVLVMDEDEVDSPEKFTVDMLQKVMEYVDREGVEGL